jgi:hypothetical protein
MLADAGGDLASLEITNTRSRARRPEPGQDCLFHTNRFWTAEMKAVEVPAAAVFTQKAPQSMQGKRLHESSELRDARFGKLIEGSKALDLEDLRGIMADHGPDNRPGSCTPCVHGNYWVTTASMQYLPRARRLRVAYTTACQAQYVTFEI